MRSSVIAIVALVLGCCLVAAEEKKCEPGSTFLDDEQCNRCVCSDDGLSFYCTKKKCITIPLEPLELTREKRQTKVCEPGSRFKDSDNCNWCTCNSAGTMAACTRKFCPKNRTRRDLNKCIPGKPVMAEDNCNWCTCNEDGTIGGCTQRQCLSAVAPHPARFTRQVATEPGRRCEPGSRFLDDDGCNWCTCSLDGKMAACTRKFCVPKPDRVTREAGRYCTPKSSFKQDCNNCICSEDGKSAACTFKFCVPQEGRVRRSIDEEKKVCEPNTTFMDEEGCNHCFCNEKGTLAACTLKYCFKSPVPVPITPLRVCEPNSTFKKDCNTCTCNEDGTAESCTEMGCHETLPKLISKRSIGDVRPTCEPNTTFKMDCNTCFCNADGTVGGCTMMGCPPKVCEPNKVTRAQDTCNTCRCNEEGTFLDCTNAICPSTTGVAPMMCTPHTVFKQDCNTCKCSTDGQKAFCTRKMCRPTRQVTETPTAEENEEKDSEVAAQHTPCTPGDIKIEGCNRCKCAKNGIVWLCTPGSACPGNGNGHSNNNNH